MGNYLKNLALSDTGFLFDPATGSTYLLNETAAFILRELKDDRLEGEVVDALTAAYEVDEVTAERDLADVMIQLKELGLKQ